MHALGSPKSHWPEHFRSLWGRPPEHTGLLSLLGWVGDTSDAADALIAWRDGSETGPDGKSLNVLGATMAELSSGVPGWRHGAFAWQYLAHGIASTGNEVQAPTAAFEAALVVLAQALEAQLSEAPGTASGPRIGPVTLHDAELPPTPACMQPWRALEKFWPELAGRAPGEFYEVTPQPLPPLNPASICCLACVPTLTPRPSHCPPRIIAPCLHTHPSPNNPFADDLSRGLTDSCRLSPATSTCAKSPARHRTILGIGCRLAPRVGRRGESEVERRDGAQAGPAASPRVALPARRAAHRDPRRTTLQPRGTPSRMERPGDDPL